MKNYRVMHIQGMKIAKSSVIASVAKQSIAVIPAQAGMTRELDPADKPRDDGVMRGNDSSLIKPIIQRKF